MNAFFKELQALRQRPIPDLAVARHRRKNYRDYLIDRTSPQYNEPLVDLRELGIAGANYYARTDNPPYYARAPGAIEHLLLRRSVAQRIHALDTRLRAFGLQVHVHDALRPTAVQAYFSEEWMPARVRERHPHWSPEQVEAKARQYWAAPTTSADRPAPHSTGGAVDLTVRLAGSGEHLYMGSIFDDVTEIAHTDFFERAAEPDEPYSDAEARQNRRLLYWLMTEGGFASHPDEWWHFSWGDQMWAALTGQGAAVFGPARYT